MHGYGAGVLGKLRIEFDDGSTQGSFVKPSSRKDDLAGGIDGHKVRNAMVRIVAEYFGVRVKIPPRLVVLAPEFVGIVWVLVLVNA
jgi:hypothetical protein